MTTNGRETRIGSFVASLVDRGADKAHDKDMSPWYAKPHYWMKPHRKKRGGRRSRRLVARRTDGSCSTAIIALHLFAVSAIADDILVAVASNFAEPMRALITKFEEQTGHTVTPSFGSTGKHYAQILHGAPFDAFFAADVKRPALLDEQGHTIPGTRFTFAIGTLVLWSPQPDLVDPRGDVLVGGRFRYLAMANPDLAPYGKAARGVLQELGIWESLQGRIVRGENVGQAYQYVASRNAELGFVALSSLQRPGHAIEGSSWIVPRDLHKPIAQQAVLLRDHAAARDFLSFVRSDAALKIIRIYGYNTESCSVDPTSLPSASP